MGTSKLSFAISSPLHLMAEGTQSLMTSGGVTFQSSVRNYLYLAMNQAFPKQHPLLEKAGVKDLTQRACVLLFILLFCLTLFLCVTPKLSCLLAHLIVHVHRDKEADYEPLVKSRSQSWDLNRQPSGCTHNAVPKPAEPHCTDKNSTV